MFVCCILKKSKSVFVSINMNHSMDGNNKKKSLVLVFVLSDIIKDYLDEIQKAIGC